MIHLLYPLTYHLFMFGQETCKAAIVPSPLLHISFLSHSLLTLSPSSFPWKSNKEQEKGCQIKNIKFINVINLFPLSVLISWILMLPPSPLLEKMSKATAWWLTYTIGDGILSLTFTTYSLLPKPNAPLLFPNANLYAIRSWELVVHPF